MGQIFLSDQFFMAPGAKGTITYKRNDGQWRSGIFLLPKVEVRENQDPKHGYMKIVYNRHVIEFEKYRWETFIENDSTVGTWFRYEAIETE